MCVSVVPRFPSYESLDVGSRVRRGTPTDPGTWDDEVLRVLLRSPETKTDGGETPTHLPVLSSTSGASLGEENEP